MPDDLISCVSTPVILTDDDRCFSDAQKLAHELGTKATQSTSDIPKDCPFLKLGASGLSLNYDKLSLSGDFTKLQPRIMPYRIGSELLVRAARFKGENNQLLVLDATAGLGEDSFILAAAGFNITLYEYNPVIAALLSDALHRAANSPSIAHIAARMTLVCGDSTRAMMTNSVPFTPDVVLLDPMFPEKQKSGLVKKKFQLLHMLERPCSDDTELLDAALHIHPRKIIIKRPPKGPYLAGRRPSYSYEADGIRFDCIILA